MAAAQLYSLPPLNYAYNALEPHISSQIMTLHHTKHHQAYINNLNNALQALSEATASADVVSHLHNQAVLAFNGGGHINHTLFWENLVPPSSFDAEPLAAPTLIKAIIERYGSVQQFQAKFTGKLLAIRGSGWGWLVQDVDSGALEIITTQDQEVVPAGKKPLMGVDMWEHAYYLQYLNNKNEYATQIWKVVNWAIMEKRFVGTVDSVFGVLKGLRSSAG